MEPQPNTESAPTNQAPVRPTMDPKVWNMNVEAPVAGLNYATLLYRFIAVVIDIVIVFVIMMVVSGVLLAILLPVLFVASSGADTTANTFGWTVGGAIAAIISFLISAGVAAWFESSKYQGTPGKIIMKIKVADVKGQRLSFQQALKRNIFKNIVSLLSILPIPFVGLLQWVWLGLNAYLIYSDPNKQSLYDKYANTVVINA